MSKSATWMPFYIGDYLRDTGHLTVGEHGSYMLLLMQAWTRDGLLPLDENRLRTLAKLNKKEWTLSRETILAFFTRTSEGYRQKRVDTELAITTAMIEQRRSAGIASGESRKRQRGGNGEATAVATEPPTADQREGQRKGNPSPSPSQKEDSGSLRSPAPGAVEVPNARDRLWAVGLPALQAMTGLPGQKTRGMLGKLLKTARDDCALVSAVLLEAEQTRPMDPFPWLQEAILARSDRREGAAEQLAREFNFSIDDLPSEADFSGTKPDDRPSDSHPQLAYSAQTRGSDDL